jgi:transcriptional regulator with XRE-family HTH domain
MWHFDATVSDSWQGASFRSDSVLPAIGHTVTRPDGGSCSMAIVQDPSVQRRRLRMELRKAREAVGYKQADVAKAMDWSPSKLIRIESGQVSISTNDLRALLNYYNIKDGKRSTSLLELAKTSRGTSFYDQYVPVLKPGFRDYLAYEGAASVIRQYDPVVLSGLLQTEEYAREILAQGLGSEEAIEQAWTVRQHRQEAHDREDPPEMKFVIDEVSLRREVGGRRTMVRQLERLKEFAALSHVDLRVLPFSVGAHPGMLGNFILLEFAEADLDDLVHIETVQDITIRDDVELIARYSDRYQRLESISLSPEDSLVFLDKVITELQ